MSFWLRLSNVFRGERLNREIDEELEAHVADAVAEGRNVADARRALGAALRLREESRDLRLLPWLDSLRADAVLGWRQIRKRKVASAAAILSLGLAMGACTAAFRIIDALLFRPLPVAHPEELYALQRSGFGFTGKFETDDGWAYPAFRLMAEAVRGRAELLALGSVERVDVSFASEDDIEKANVQYVSGRMFVSFGLRPAVGRLFGGAEDDLSQPQPYAVLSHHYWTQRFGGAADVVGRKVRIGTKVFEIVGVSGQGFTGTEPGSEAGIFLPVTMHTGAREAGWTWMRTLVRIPPGTAPEQIVARVAAVSRAFEENRAKGYRGLTPASIQRFLDRKVEIRPVWAGVSSLQKEYRRALQAMAVLVALVLLIACANVANLLAAQAAARAREMALRVSIGAGRGRLVQLVLVESGLMAILAAAAGGAFAAWAAPFVVSHINLPDDPAQLAMPVDWRVTGFAFALTVLVACLFGLAPALRASGVQPASALKGGSDPHSRRRLMYGLIALQVTFCFVVLFVSGLFVETFHKLSERPMGFVPDGLLVVDATPKQPQLPVVWEELTGRIRALPGVESAATSCWPLIGAIGWNGFVSVHNGPPSSVPAYMLAVSPGWLETMKIPLLDGSDFRPDAVAPGVAIVNETFVKTFFPGERALGQTFRRVSDQFQIVGIVRDTPYQGLRAPTPPLAFFPQHELDKKGELRPVRSMSFLVRVKGDAPLGLAPALRAELARARPDFRVTNVRTFQEILDGQTLQERLLALLALFFTVVALLLAGVGLYGVLDYSVLQRRKEIGIRMAIGARVGDIGRLVTGATLRMVLAGSAAGVGLGLGAARWIESLLFEVKASDPRMLVLPWLVIVVTALVASMPAVVRAVRTDPAKTLRAD
ncbi:ADOP family duplicated permease [Paludibaculum fermentans]|uniref:ABC transporter permease n=1 Tax=Paludibaculum fermentans TaxID=1473598 RepID=A0A7S7NVH9_PALFE|nr:ADOP family duplicated permease [Paludibaculum fermentans]QOY89954.1 ABC transporter permease [Paludibaculum fermentans]